jgi:pimeloyl-ACP methyl ester carboxylesterase
MFHRFTADERETLVAYLSQVLQGAGQTAAAESVAQLAGRICLAALHTGEVYEASVRLRDRFLVGPDVQKLVVETERGRLVGILEFPGPGGPYPAVLFLHGVPAGKEDMTDDARRYRARGLATLRLDLPGYGETTVPDTQSVADAEILQEVVTAVLAHDRVDSRGVGITGWSAGPWFGAHLCARDNRVRAMVAISPQFDPLDTRPGIPWPGALSQAIQEARVKSGKLVISQPVNEDWYVDYRPEASAFLVAHLVRCPVLLVYGSLEPERYRAQAEEFAALAPNATTRPWRSSIHILLNMPEALEDAAEWMKQQLLGT